MKPKIEPIAPGHYVFSRDVQNPTPDRRHTRSERFTPVWKEGTRVYVRAQHYDREQPPAVTYIEFVGAAYPSLNTIGPGFAEQYEAIKAVLVPVDETYQTCLHRLSMSERFFLEHLVARGKVTLADLQQIYDEEMGKDE